MISREEFDKWMGRTFDAPTQTILVRKLDGTVHEADANKIVPIPPQNVARAMANPLLHELIVFPV